MTADLDADLDDEDDEEREILDSLTVRNSAGLLFPKPKLGPLYLSATLLCGNSKHLSHSSVLWVCAYEEGDKAPLAATSGHFPPLKGIIKILSAFERNYWPIQSKQCLEKVSKNVALKKAPFIL